MTMVLEASIPYLSELSYLAIPIVILLMSIGFLPIMEEIILLTIGYLAFTGIFNLGIAMVVTVASIILADNVYFYLGSHGHLLLRRYLNGGILARVKNSVDKHGPVAVFTARFVPGVRFLMPWVASTSGMRWRRFALADGFAALLQTPLFIIIGYALGPSVQRVIGFAQSLHKIMPLLVLIVLVFAAILICINRRSMRQFVSQFSGGANGRV